MVEEGTSYKGGVGWRETDETPSDRVLSNLSFFICSCIPAGNYCKINHLTTFPKFY